MPDAIKELHPITGIATTEEYCHAWNKMRVNTGSSPYGPIFCDYIAGVQDSEVASIDASLSSIPYIAGFSPSQWQEASNVMIPQKKTSRHVEKLRIIVLFDAMFNMGNKRIEGNDTEGTTTEYNPRRGIRRGPGTTSQYLQPQQNSRVRHNTHRTPPIRRLQQRCKILL